MKAIDRIDLLDRIGVELQSRMSFTDIDHYFKRIGVDTNKPTSGVNSKRIYAKDLLADESDELVARVAEELDIPHELVVPGMRGAVEASFWDSAHFRLFISHLSSFKHVASALQAALRDYGISAFVAHVDIEPTKEWQIEIESGLASMDALAAILMPGSKESDWTDQEVGVAIGRGVLVVPIIKGLVPYGFIGKFQGLNASGKTVKVVAAELFEILVRSPKTRARMIKSLVDTTLQAANATDAQRKLGILDSVEAVPKPFLEHLRDGARSSAALGQPSTKTALDDLLARNGLQPVADIGGGAAMFEDIPF